MNEKNTTPAKTFLSADNRSFLLSSRAFAPLFWSQFFAAFNDHFVKNTLIFLIVKCSSSEYQASLISLTSGIFSLPHFLFSATGGQLADCFSKAKVARLIKFFTLFIAVATAGSVLLSSITLLMICLFLFSCASALFGPIKYAALPDHMAKIHLPRANAWIETATFTAILLGTLWAGLSFNFQSELQIIPALIIIILAVFSWATSCFMPENTPAQSNITVDHNIIRATISILKYCTQEKNLFVASLIVSWFWFMGATILSVIPILTASLNCLLYGTIIFFTLFSIFSAIGSAMVAWLSAERINLLLAVIGTFVFGFVCIDLSFVINGLHPELKVETLSDFFSHSQLLHIMFDFSLAAISGIFLVVPSFAALQAWTKPDHRARVIAANNILNAAFIVIGASIITFIQYLGVSIDIVIIMLGIASLAVAIAMLKYLPTNPFLDFIFILFRLFFRLEIKGVKNLAKAGKSPILIFNHSSFLDSFLALVICETINLHAPVIVIDANTAKFWWFRPFIKHINAFPMDPSHPFANRYLIHTVKQRKPLVIFLEKDTSTTNAFKKVYESAAWIVDKTKAKVVPIKIYGLERTLFSSFSGIHCKLFPKICATINKPVDLNIDANLKSRARRQTARNKLYRIITNLIF
ncbi:MFS transporter [Bartonella jaculi]|uniref:Phospholipid/glycerol acyltransferase domain-containing protein n=1 Tax=Bartonella jaculi TaxID=686226 RepID=A0ABP9N1R5_9HYPH